jgi:hypothetical protein
MCSFTVVGLVWWWQTIFEGSPSLALYTAPLLLLHPTQLVLGSLLTPFFTKYIREDPNPQRKDT